MIVPWKELAPATLHAVIEEFVTRDGTDNGYVSVGLDQKIERVRNMLERGDAQLVFDAATGTCNIISKEQGRTLSE